MSKHHLHDYKAIFGHANASDYDSYRWPDDIKQAIDGLIKEHYEPYTSERLEGFILKRFKAAAEEADLGKRGEKLKEALDAAWLQYRHYKPKTTEPMPEEVKEMLKELNETRRAVKKKDAAPPAPKKEKPPPVHSDPKRQLEFCNKYPWAVPGSFKQDPLKAGGTLVSIKCECGSTREIHLSDLFQVRKCNVCKRLGK